MTYLEITSDLAERQLVTFHIGNDEFGADIMNVKAIVRVSEITKVPNSPHYVEGVCNLRGSVLPVIDATARLNVRKIDKEREKDSRILVVDINGKTTGVIVDKVSEVMRISTTEIEETPSIMKNANMDYLSGIVKLNNGKRLIMLLDLMKVLDIEEIEGFNLFENEATLKNKNSSSEIEKIKEEQLVSFIIDKEEYGLDIMQVKEIIRVSEIVKVPNLGEYIEGVVSLRDSILPILDLRKYFCMEDVQVTDRTRILVVDIGEFTCGLMVDKVSEVLRISRDVIQSPPNMFSKDQGDQLKGIAKLEDGKRLILLLDPVKLVESDKLLDVEKLRKNSYEQETKSIEKQLMDDEQVVTFKLANEEFAVKINYVQEINRMTKITKVPRAPYFIDGIVNLRGNIIPVMDLRKLFNLPEKEITDSNRIIIVDLQNKKTGIIVDSVTEVLRFGKKLIELPPDILCDDIDKKYIEGIGKLSDGNRMIVILNLNKVIQFH
ncbi:chemotaxis protein CheW [Clostridium magnum]|uniref:Chemotaxis protein CheW n=1 Tax=Clostridium magnum DSM 2767 TaxID=1121326 RepID=A0A162T7X1_9CLOT|nr:chemotaxis protein CheW [Clostridium magnum]KZL92340.1 chemotaxis protein CheW [Clostridium magnum DSM 2767]SHH12842.1 purine-binding chemotaxis protein CheW [Clostridium magnum DSM 2767]